MSEWMFVHPWMFSGLVLAALFTVAVSVEAIAGAFSARGGKTGPPGGQA